MNLVEEHFNKTKKLLKAIDKKEIAHWLLNEGYFPEQYVFPPCFCIENFLLDKKPKFKNLKAKLKRKEVTSISYPKSLLTSRVFSIQHPDYYHDIVYWLMDDWEGIVNHLFNNNLKIYSYSLPIPLNAKEKGSLGSLRSGRLIYEWIAMAEKDLVAEANKYSLIIRSDITNFYNSVYTHSIGWALHGYDNAFRDKYHKNLIGSKIDCLVQYANSGRTNGLPVGSALSDLIAEIILVSIDVNVSDRLKEIDFLATRFKDDYRILCHSRDDAEKILKVLTEELVQFNLLISESKTHILELPSGLYRRHDRAYHPYSLKWKKAIDFKTFEFTLLTVLDIHKEYPGTSVLEKFLSELFNKKHELKLRFSIERNGQKKQILKTFSLLMLLKRESKKIICHVLAIIEAIYSKHGKKHNLKRDLKLLIESEIVRAANKQSIYELLWLVFYSRYVGLGIDRVWLNSKINPSLRRKEILKSVCESRQYFFTDSKVKLFRKPKDCRDITLAKRLAAFERKKDE